MCIPQSSLLCSATRRYGSAVNIEIMFVTYLWLIQRWSPIVERLVKKLERIWKEGLGSSLRYYTVICLKGPKKIKVNSSQDSRPTIRDLNQNLPIKKQEC
jgi:hypothetical protein